MAETGANESEAFLRRLTAGDERCLTSVLLPAPEFENVAARAPVPRGLDRRTVVLVRLAALLALDAPPASMRWAVELACTIGVQDAELIGVLLACGAATSAAQATSGAESLAQVLGYGGDSSREQARLAGAGHRL